MHEKKEVEKLRRSEVKLKLDGFTHLRKMDVIRVNMHPAD